jgi:5-formyltetrahydrofolate cyclo-ligase
VEPVAEKKALRNAVALKKKSCSAEDLKQLSERIWRHVERLPAFREAASFACYHALADEVQTRDFMERWRHGKQVFLPAVKASRLLLRRYEGEAALCPGAFGIMEPKEREEAPEVLPDVIIVPGIAFDRRLNRLGRGGGYYDRLLTDTPVPTIGVCFHFQLFDRIPVGHYDRKAGRLVTEEGEILSD